MTLSSQCLGQKQAVCTKSERKGAMLLSCTTSQKWKDWHSCTQSSTLAIQQGGPP